MCVDCNYTPFGEERVYRSHCVGMAGCLSVCLSVGRSVGRSVDRSVESHILFGLFLTNNWVVFNTIIHEASIPRGDVHILKGLQLHVTLQSYGPFTY